MADQLTMTRGMEEGGRGGNTKLNESLKTDTITVQIWQQAKHAKILGPASVF